MLAIAGLAVGGVGVWWMLHARPAPGPVIDFVALDAEWAVVVRREAHSDRALVELLSTRQGRVWDALVPRYAGRPGAPGIGAGEAAVTVRVERGRPEVWALATRDATKLGGISLDEYADGRWVAAGPSRVVSVGDGVRSFEVVDGTHGATIVAIELGVGAVRWHHAVGAPIVAMIARDGRLEVTTTTGAVVLDPATGAPIDGAPAGPPPDPRALPDGLTFTGTAITRGSTSLPWPPGAPPPQPYHVAGGALWIARDHKLEVHDLKDFSLLTTAPL